MIRIWRLCRAAHAQAPLSGEGARIYGGRWNAKGTRMVYCAGSLSLACMEVLVHLDLRRLPRDYQAIAIDLPDDVPRKILATPELPPDWNQVPGPESLKQLGSAWAATGSEAVLVVPSAVIPFEFNYLVNPGHVDAGRLTVLPAIPFPSDDRLARPT